MSISDECVLQQGLLDAQNGHWDTYPEETRVG